MGWPVRADAVSVLTVVLSFVSVCVCGVGIGGSGQDLRCKTRTLTKIPTKASDL